MKEAQEKRNGRKQAFPHPLTEKTFLRSQFFPGLSSFYKYIPNTLTLFRLLATPLSIWALAQHQLTVAFWLFFSASITDWFDGYLARRWQVTSQFGQILDPIADKSLILSLFFTLSLYGYIPWWLTILVWIRDVLILSIGGGIILTRHQKPALPPHFIGKVSTAFQMLFIGTILLTTSTSLSSIESYLMIILFYGVALTTILSGIVYGRVALQVFRQPSS